VWCHLYAECYVTPWHQQRFPHIYLSIRHSLTVQKKKYILIQNYNIYKCVCGWRCLSPYILVVHISVQLNDVHYSIRLFGLVGIIYTDCSAPLALHVRPYLDWPQCASPAVILALYWLLATETRFYFIKVRNYMKSWLLNIHSKGTVTWLIILSCSYEQNLLNNIIILPHWSEASTLTTMPSHSPS